MRLADVLSMPLSEIRHMNEPYDPVRAHEYYIENRQLKGRTGAAKTAPAPVVKGTVKPTSVKKTVPVAPKKTAAQLKKEVDVKVKALQSKLKHLQEVLHELTMLAQKRSGVKPAPTKTAGAKKTTPAKKSAAAAQAHAYYEKHKAQTKTLSPTQQQAQLQAQIKQVEAKIQAIKAQLAAAAKAVQLKRAPVGTVIPRPLSSTKKG
jgi:DNA mismatch repair ATPase MutS